MAWQFSWTLMFLFLDYLDDLNRELKYMTRKLAQLTTELKEEKRMHAEEKRLRIDAERKLQLYIEMNRDDNICIGK